MEASVDWPRSGPSLKSKYGQCLSHSWCLGPLTLMTVSKYRTHFVHILKNIYILICSYVLRLWMLWHSYVVYYSQLWFLLLFNLEFLHNPNILWMTCLFYNSWLSRDRNWVSYEKLCWLCGICILNKIKKHLRAGKPIFTYIPYY